MNNRRLGGLVALMMVGMSSFAWADECQITLSQPVVDYHTMRREDIKATQQDWHKMADRDVNVNVFCPEPQKMAVLVQGASGEKGRFMLGQSGGVAVKIADLFVDGKSYTVGKTVDQLNFTPVSGSPSPFYLHNNEAVIALENNQIPSGRQMSFKVTLSPVLKDAAFSHVTDQTSLESDLTWSLLTK